MNEWDAFIAKWEKEPELLTDTKPVDIAIRHCIARYGNERLARAMARKEGKHFNDFSLEMYKRSKALRKEFGV